MKKVIVGVALFCVIGALFSVGMHFDYQDHNDPVMVKLAGH